AMSLTGGQNVNLTIAASTEDRALVIAVSRLTGPGTYTLSAEVPVRAVQVTEVLGNAIRTWSSQNGGGGSITVTSVTTSRLQGTFAASLRPFDGADEVLQVSGSFDMGRP